jgi:hypothetical protein
MSIKHLVEWELGGETEVLGGNVPSATLSTTNAKSPDLGLNPGHCSGKLAINRMSYGMATKTQTNTFAKI